MTPVEFSVIGASGANVLRFASSGLALLTNVSWKGLYRGKGKWTKTEPNCPELAPKKSSFMNKLARNVQNWKKKWCALTTNNQRESSSRRNAKQIAPDSAFRYPGAWPDQTWPKHSFLNAFISLQLQLQLKHNIHDHSVTRLSRQDPFQSLIRVAFALENNVTYNETEIYGVWLKEFSLKRSTERQGTEKKSTVQHSKILKSILN